VEMTYTAPARKDFKILSESGSKWIVNRVLKRLIDGEKEAQEAAIRASVELNTRNYNFTSLERQTDSTGCGYVLEIQPKVPNKFLYRGRIWVNDQDFAVCRIEAEPSKNPSIWITKTEIRHHYQKFEDFWLPVENQSISSLRLGGRATLTITYQDYEINAVHPVKDNSASAGH
jgi:outer membrane lipoprotein-sorting protein